MHSTHVLRLAAATVIASLALGCAGCGESSAGGGDKAGGAEPVQPRMLTLASQSGSPPQLAKFAKEVERRSNGTLVIRFEDGWRRGEDGYEQAVLDDVKTGTIDMAWVGARIFDTVGADDFQALLAPLLVDSYELQGRVFAAGIPARMLAGVEVPGVVGLAVLPGPMRKVLGVAQPILRPADFAGRVVGVQTGGVAAQTLEALGATPKAVPAEAPLDGLDAYEQQISSIAGNSYDADATAVSANLNLWPRPLVLVIGADLFASLSPAQQAALRDASIVAADEALAMTERDEAEGAAILCRRGLPFATASPTDLAALRTAVEPVYASLSADPATKAYLDEIAALKQQVPAPGDAPVCDAESSAVAASPIEGRYATTIEAADWAGVTGGGGEEGTFELEFQNGEVTVYQPDTHEVGFRGTYTLFRDTIEMTGPEDRITARWSLDGDRLAITDIDAAGPYRVVLGSHAWRQVTPDALAADTDVEAAASTPLDGTWDYTTTAADFPDGPDIDEENYGYFRFVLDRGRFEMTQKNGPSDRWTRGRYTVSDETVEFEIQDYGGTAPNGASEKTGEVFAFAWSLYRDTLTMAPVPGAVSPENFTARPWTRQE